jgi:hypothetical protein
MLLDRRPMILYSLTAAANTLLFDPFQNDGGATPRINNGMAAASIHVQDLVATPSLPMDISVSVAATTKPLPTISNAVVVDCICDWTPKSFRDAVRQSGGKFLYRGEEDLTTTAATATAAAEKSHFDPAMEMLLLLSSSSSLRPNSAPLQDVSNFILNPEPDLLLPDTYGDPKALAYFECLEARLSSSSSFVPPFGHLTSSLSSSGDSSALRVAKPSNGHIGTSDPQQAGQWGSVVSVWPLGDALSYVWLRDRAEFFSNTMDDGNNEECQRDDNDSNLVRDQQLDQALLQRNREVLFCSWFHHHDQRPAATNVKLPVSAFLAVPIEYDNALRKALQQADYGL